MMSIELKIRNLLNEGKDIADIADTLLYISVSKKTKRTDLYSIAQFFILTGLYKDLFRQFPRRFFEKELIAWPHFVEILMLNHIKINHPIVEAIFEGSKATKAQKYLALNKKWQVYDIRMQNIRTQLWDKMQTHLENMKEVLKQKIEFLKNQRLINDEKKAFEKYMQLFPEDESINTLFNDFKERQARNIINRKLEQRKLKDIGLFTNLDIDEEEEK
ncbi:MAG: hypothetical protein KDD40_09895, partial [Bdellovibrionales bacterium]|nr:hypothetical protein [Bdellovibrionales bacterium]